MRSRTRLGLRAGVWLLGALMAASGAARAQDASVEQRLREAVRRTTVELRALQDNQAAMQAALDQARQRNEQLTRQLDELKAGAAARPAGPDPLLAELQAAIPAVQEQNRALRSAVGKLQGVYQQAAEAARAQTAEAQRLAQGLQSSDGRLGLCRAANAKLIGVANDILHLYRTPAFRALILGSHEPLLGFKQVELQNIVQDYEDRIREHQHFNEAPAAAPAVAPGPTKRR